MSTTETKSNGRGRREAGPISDPFDLDALRLPQGFDVSAEKVLMTVPVRKPSRQDFFRYMRGRNINSTRQCWS